MTLTRRSILGLLASGAALPALCARAAGSSASLEVPSFAKDIASGALPPMSERLPKTPRVIDMAASGRMPGRHGGKIRMLIGGQRDVRYVPIDSYSRLVGYDHNFAFVPDILESFETEADKRFTFRLREGHRWSDGTLVTTEDFRFAWEDFALDPDISPGGAPMELRVRGQAPTFEVLDERTVRFAWDDPNPDFLGELAAPVPARLLMPAAYLKKFHARYASAESLAPLIKKFRVDDWVSLIQKASRQSRPENPDLPTLEAWMPRTKPPAEQFVFARNPYFHRVDENGRQLPYVDRLELNVSSADIIPAKTGTGDSDLQFSGLDFADYTFLKDAETRFPLHVALWKRTQGSRMALMPNLNVTDPVWRAVFRDLRVRRALSLGIDRHEINMAVFFGLAAEGNDTVLPESPLYRPALASMWASHDPELAASLLDAAGLVKPKGSHIRRLPDGRRMQIIVETPGESSLQTDILQLIGDHWRAIGVDLAIRTSQRDIFRARVISGTIMMSVWEGLDNGVPTPDMSPADLAPTAEDQYQWPLWGLNFVSDGRSGEKPEIPEAAQLLDLYREWRRSTDSAERARIWTQMLTIRAEQVFTIGTVNGALQPVVRAKSMRNLPEKALYGFAPTSYLGVYQPDSLWFDTAAETGTGQGSGGTP